MKSRLFIEHDVDFDKYQYGFWNVNGRLSSTTDLVASVRAKWKKSVLAVDLPMVFEVADQSMLLRKLYNSTEPNYSL